MILGFTGGSGTGTGLTYKGAWDALTNNPFLQSSIGTNGDYYIVSVAGNTNLDGITVWGVGDWAIFNGGVWQKIDNTATGGTVTSVGASAGTGISIGGTNPITTSGIFSITNTAPDQVVSLTDGTGISTSGSYPNFTITNTTPDQTVVLNNGTGINVTGTYPNFTITNTQPSSGGTVTSVGLSAGTGINLSGTNPITSSGTITVTNSAPDQTVVLNNGTGISVTGTYPNFTITNTSPSSGGTVTSVGLSMPSAFSVANSPITGSGTINVTGSGTTAQYIRGDGTLATFPSLTGYVPYTGATNNVDLGTFNLTADHITLNTNPSGAGYVVGTTQWNNTIGSSETLLKGGSVSLKNGVDLVARVVNKVVPNQTLTKAQYQVVKVSGATGGRLSVDLAQANIDLNSADTLGVVIETIPTNLEGFIMAVGQLNDINTTGSLQGETWLDGDTLYLSPTTPGAMTKVKPTGLTGHIVVLGYVEYAHPTQGSIYVKIMNGWELDELHNVYITNPQNNNILTYVTPANLWENKTLGNIIGGTTSQYVRGDGSVATFPTTTGGGSSVTYYLNGSVSEGTIGGNPYYQMSKSAIIGTNTDFNLTNTAGYIAEFITDPNDPSLLSIPQGAWNLLFYFSASDNIAYGTFYAELYKYDGATFTLISSSSLFPESITNGTTIDLYTTSLAVPLTSLAITDRLAIRIYVNTNGNRTITLHTQDSHLCEVVTTFSTGINTLNSLSTQVQYFATGTSGTDFNINSAASTHTFNLPTASATNRGALSSGDWTTFNNKVSTSRTISTSLPLSGGGDLSANRTLSIVQSNTTTDGYLSSTDWNTFNGKQNLLQSGVNIKTINGSSILGAGNVTTGTITSIATSSPLTGGTITSSGTIGISQSSGSSDGYLSSTDWNTFNNKVSTSRTISTTSPLSGGGDLTANRTLSIAQANAITDGYLSLTDWNTFNGKQNAITLTTTGTSGAATLIGNTLNIPQYAGGLTYFTEAQSTTAPNATVYVDSLTAVSTTTNADFVIKPKGNGAILAAIPDNLATGGNKRGSYAVDLQMVRAFNTQVASGIYSFVVGQNNTASADQACALGFGNTASGPYSIAAGVSNVSSGDGSVALGHSSTAASQAAAIGRSCTASASQSVAIGNSSAASAAQSVALGNNCGASGVQSVAFGSYANTFSIVGRQAFASGRAAADASGSLQSSKLILGRTTSTITTGVLLVDFVNYPTPSTNNQLILQNNNSVRFKGTIVARQTASTNTAAWDIDGLIIRGANAASTTLLIGNVNVVQNTPAWGNPTLSADTTNGGLSITINSTVAVGIKWVCSLDTTEVINA